MEDLFLKFKLKDNQEFSQTLDTFLNNYASVTKFEFLDQENFRSQIWEAVLLHLKNKEEVLVHQKCLSTLRILSRDKTSLDSILTQENLNLILEYAGLNCKQENYFVTTVTNETQKLLCNILFNSTKVQNMILETNCLACVIDRISKYDSDVQHDTKLFDVRVIFLISALIPSTRSIIINELHGDITLINLLDSCSKYINMEERNIYANDAVLSSEILKALFNLFIEQKDPSAEEFKSYINLLCIVKNLLLSENAKDNENLVSNVVNLLTVIPTSYYIKLIAPALKLDEQNNSVDEANADMTVVNVLLQFLNDKLDCKTSLIENMSPILTCLIKMCRAERLIRKYIRMQVLPPLKDVMKRPEEGSTLRNKLCKLLTTPLTEVRDLNAEFLFVLCKEKVGRMIKYTGYGNAAGMFANKGLLGPDHAKVDYSSESEDSDTEEYEQYKDHINPVIGCYEKPKSNPFEGMTEEQKEYEAMKLVSLVDQLQRGGIIQPCTVGDDGKPKAIEHVLELKEKLPKQQIHKRDSDTD
ncbi:synembryn [Phymastichus coffea]|uniref:synembryn n=1 Tax=Phymastichus coffea TaxID=108790 RepID=UPI00273B1566|nr:synembryn [Phymastichus coffea]